MFSSPLLLFTTVLIISGIRICECSSSQCTSISPEALFDKKNQGTASNLSEMMMVFNPGNHIQCRGSISTWELHLNGRSQRSLEITFTVWRPLESAAKPIQYTLVGKNVLTVNTSERFESYQLSPDPEDQIDVEPGYVIGFYVNQTEGIAPQFYLVRLDSEQPMYFISTATLEDDQPIIDTSMAIITLDQVPLVTAKIVDKSAIITSTFPSTFTSSSIIPSSHLGKITQTSHTSTVEISSTSSTVPLTTSLVTDNPLDEQSDGSELLLIGIPIIAIVVTLIIIIGTVIFVALMCSTIRRRERSEDTVENPNYDAKRKSTSNDYAFPLNRNPSYSADSIDYRRMRQKVISEHIYESCCDPYEYMEPVSLASKTASSMPISASNRLTAVSDIYEIPFAFTMNVCPQEKNTKKKVTTSTRGSHQYLTPLPLTHQPAPVSPGYDVPVCPDAPEERDTFEESARYKEPGWIYRS